MKLTDEIKTRLEQLIDDANALLERFRRLRNSGEGESLQQVKLRIILEDLIYRANQEL